MERFRACFADLADPRTGNAQRHDLLEILLIALAATLCGAEGCVDMALFGRAKEPFLRAFCACRAASRATTPSRACSGCSTRTRSRPASPASSPRSLRAGRARARRWWRSTARRRGARSTAGAASRPLHLISAWAVEQRLVLGQRKVDGDSNETRALPELLALLTWTGGSSPPTRCTARTPRRRAILDRGGDYCPGAQGQPAGAADEDVRLCWTIPEAAASDAADDRRRPRPHRDPPCRGRHEVAWLAESHGFPGLAGGRQGDRHARDRRPEPPPPTATICCPSRSPPPAWPRSCAPIGRSRTACTGCSTWSWTRTSSRARKDHAPENLARLRRFALNLLRANRDQRLDPRQDQTRRLGRRLPPQNPRRRLMRLPWPFADRASGSNNLGEDRDLTLASSFNLSYGREV